jgi:hypothetical protein
MSSLECGVGFGEHAGPDREDVLAASDDVDGGVSTRAVLRSGDAERVVEEYFVADDDVHGWESGEVGEDG